MKLFLLSSLVFFLKIYVVLAVMFKPLICYEVRSQLHCFASEDLVLPMLFVEKAVLSLLNYLGTLVRNSWAVYMKVYS